MRLPEFREQFNNVIANLPENIDNHRVWVVVYRQGEPPRMSTTSPVSVKYDSKDSTIYIAI